MKTIIFYASATAVFGLLAYGSVNYTNQFSANGAINMSQTAQKGSTAPFRMSHDWTKNKR